MADVLADFEALGEDFAFDDVAVNAWAGVTIFALAAEQAADLTGPSIRAALDRMGELDIEVVPPLSFQAPVDGIPTFERTFNNQVIFNRVEDGVAVPLTGEFRSEEHTSELQSLMRISYAVFCLKKKRNTTIIH